MSMGYICKMRTCNKSRVKVNNGLHHTTSKQCVDLPPKQCHI